MVSGGIAGFTKRVRRLFLKEPGPQEPVFPDMRTLLSIFHELTHAGQDTEMIERHAPTSVDDITRVRDEIFAQVQTTKTKVLVVLEHEVEAAANESAIFDVLTRALGNERNNVAACMQRLQWPASHVGDLRHYIRMTEEYLRGPAALHSYTKARYTGTGAPFFKVSDKGNYVLDRQ